MPKTYIHLVRHAQGFHNISKENETIHDPDLTPFGEEQCAALRKNFPYHDKVTHLVASPMRRTLRTCLLGFAPEVEAGKKVVALPEVQELSPLPCDIGSDPSVLARDFDASKVDLSLVKEGWNDKSAGSPWEPTIKGLENRARKARVWLRDLAAQSKDADEVHIVVVSHGGFIHFFTEDWDGMNPSKGMCMSPSAGQIHPPGGWTCSTNVSFAIKGLAGRTQSFGRMSSSIPAEMTRTPVSGRRGPAGGDGVAARYHSRRRSRES